MDKAEQFIPVQRDYLIKNTILNFDLYGQKGSEYHLIRRSFLPIIDRVFQDIEDKTDGKVFIRIDSLNDYHTYLEENLDVLLNITSVSQIEKAGILFKIGSNIAEKAYAKPNDIDILKRCKEVVENMISYFRSGSDAFMQFEAAVPVDYELHTHCLNVAALSLQLAIESGIENNSQLTDLGLGALLHDVGMTIVPNKIRTKTGPLTDREYMMVKKHVLWGYNILKETGFLSEEALMPVLEHHERIDGRGYPSRKIGDDLHTFGKIVAIAVVFDAMNTNRSYKNAVTSFPALKEMLAMDGAFDPQLIKTFIKMMGRPQK
ncbi:MAG: HD domain-containing protein [candidate division Zixibacteria bacterium]|nr:HD domain-containing protein [candidate division Zixibacteria bacterium]